MNVSEYVVRFLECQKVRTVFAVVGGASLWLVKALSESDEVKTVFTNHEQAAAMAADGWARINRKPGIVFTINGPGMTNAVTGIAQAWVDSSPVILITGNSNSKSVRFEREHAVRQYGTQDLPTDQIMKPITKKSFFVDRPEQIRSCLQEAFYTALSGRPGPVCIEIPIDVQSSEVPKEMKEWSAPGTVTEAGHLTDIHRHVVQLLEQAKRPLILAGQGVRLAESAGRLCELAERMDIPVVTSRMGIDVIPTDSRYFVGRPGNHGDRASHLALQSCDVLLILGCRLAPNTTGYDVTGFSPQSYKILVEIEKESLVKYGMRIDESICEDVCHLIDGLIKTAGKSAGSHEKWVRCCNTWKQSYPVIQKEYKEGGSLSTYSVIDTISSLSGEGDYVIADTGSCCCIAAQVWKVKPGQRVFISGGLSAMGYWATSIGLALAKPVDNRLICLVGDGSLQMNIHELATIERYHLPVKLFVINNNGYQFVKMSQRSYGIIPPFGTDTAGGVPIANTEKIAAAYGIPYIACGHGEELADRLRFVMEAEGSILCEVFVDEDQEVCPRLKSTALENGAFQSPQYENLYPYLPEAVLKNELERARGI